MSANSKQTLPPLSTLDLPSLSSITPRPPSYKQHTPVDNASVQHGPYSNTIHSHIPQVLESQKASSELTTLPPILCYQTPSDLNLNTPLRARQIDISLHTRTQDVACYNYQKLNHGHEYPKVLQPATVKSLECPQTMSDLTVTGLTTPRLTPASETSTLKRAADIPTSKIDTRPKKSRSSSNANRRSANEYVCAKHSSENKKMKEKISRMDFAVLMRELQNQVLRHGWQLDGVGADISDPLLPWVPAMNLNSRNSAESGLESTKRETLQAVLNRVFYQDVWIQAGEATHQDKRLAGAKPGEFKQVWDSLFATNFWNAMLNEAARRLVTMPNDQAFEESRTEKYDCKECLQKKPDGPLVTQKNLMVNRLDRAARVFAHNSEQSADQIKQEARRGARATLEGEFQGLCAEFAMLDLNSHKGEQASDPNLERKLGNAVKKDDHLSTLEVRIMRAARGFSASEKEARDLVAIRKEEARWAIWETKHEVASV